MTYGVHDFVNLWSGCVKHDARESEDDAGRPPDHYFLENHRCDGHLNVQVVVPNRWRSQVESRK